MTALLTFITGPVALCVGLLALAATIGWQVAGELPAGARGEVLAKHASSAFIPLVVVLCLLTVGRLLLLS